MPNDSKNGNGASGSSTITEPLQLQEIIQMGEAAAQLLNNPVYNVAHRMAVNTTLEAWASTSPKEVQRRESLYHETQALGRVAQMMAGLVERAQQVIQEQSESQHASEQEYLNNQGFGLGENFGAREYN